MRVAEEFSPKKPVVIGLLGGVACGKSTVAALLADFGLLVLDADRAAKEVLESPELLPRLVAILGRDIVVSEGEASEGQLDRAKIADLVFADASLRRRLEELTHPAIRERLMRELAQALDSGRSVVMDVPLLLEGGLIERCDHSIYIQVRAERRRQRALARGMTAEDWLRREKSQEGVEEKRQRAEFVLDNERDNESENSRLKLRLWGLLEQIQEA